jgi:hypothetical protein
VQQIEFYKLIFLFESWGNQKPFLSVMMLQQIQIAFLLSIKKGLYLCSFNETPYIRKSVYPLDKQKKQANIIYNICQKIAFIKFQITAK